VEAGAARVEWAPAGLPASPAPVGSLRVVRQSVHGGFPGIRPWGCTTDDAEGVLLKQLAGRSFRSTAYHLRVGVGTLRRLVLRRVRPQPDVSAAPPRGTRGDVEHSFRHQDMAVVSPRRQMVVLLPDDRVRTVEGFFRERPDSARGRVRAVCVDLKDP